MSAPPRQAVSGRAVTAWRRALICLAAVLASTATAVAVAMLNGPRWVAAGVASFTLAVVSGTVWIPQEWRRRWQSGGREQQNGPG